MKLVSSFFLFMLIFSSAWAQDEATSVNADDAIGKVVQKAHVHEIEQYNFDQKFSGQILLKTEYGEHEFKNSADVSLVSKVKVTKVELVYTKFPLDENFQDGFQKSLNYKRFETLYGKLPTLFDDEEVSWVMVSQTSAKSVEEGKKLFHGFVLHYTVKPKKKK